MKVRLMYIFLLICILSSCSSNSDKVFDNINEYENYVDQIYEYDDFFPTIGEIGTIENSEVVFIEKTGLVMSKSLMIRMKLSPSEYQNFISNQLNEYKFFTESIKNKYGNVVMDYEFAYNDFQFYIINNDNFIYPKLFGMIGISNDEYEIIFMMYYNDDRDIISDFESFIESNFQVE